MAQLLSMVMAFAGAVMLILVLSDNVLLVSGIVLFVLGIAWHLEDWIRNL